MPLRTASGFPVVDGGRSPEASTTAVTRPDVRSIPTMSSVCHTFAHTVRPSPQSSSFSWSSGAPPRVTGTVRRAANVVGSRTTRSAPPSLVITCDVVWHMPQPSRS